MLLLSSSQKIPYEALQLYVPQLMIFKEGWIFQNFGGFAVKPEVRSLFYEWMDIINFEGLYVSI